MRVVVPVLGVAACALLVLLIAGVPPLLGFAILVGTVALMGLWAY